MKFNYPIPNLMLKKIYLYLPVVFFLVLFFIFKNPGTIKFFIGYIFIFGATIVAGLFFIKGQFQKRWPFLLEAIFFTAAALMFFLSLSQLIWLYAFSFLFCFVFGLFFYRLYQIFYQPRSAKPFALERMAVWLNFIISYWFLSGLQGVLVDSYFQKMFFLSLGLVFILFFWLEYYLLNLNDSFGSSQLSDSLIIGLILTEIYLVVGFLPLSFYLNALIISLICLIINKIWLKIYQKKSPLMTVN
jgi:hypothetical protein